MGYVTCEECDGTGDCPEYCEDGFEPDGEDTCSGCQGGMSCPYCFGEGEIEDEAD